MKKNMNFLSRLCMVLLLLPAVVMLSSCGGGSGGSGSGETGTLSLSITDSPVDEAEKVVVVFTGVELKPAAGPSRNFYFCKYSPDNNENSSNEINDNDSSDEQEVFVSENELCDGNETTTREIDLLALQGWESEVLLDEVEVPAGRYNWIRLKVNAERGKDDSYIQFDLDGDDVESLWIPSGAETGLKLVQGFVVPAGGDADFTIDFDLRKSVHNPLGFPDYILRPALRLVDNTEVGSIAGKVAVELINIDGVNAVYVFEGEDAQPLDIRGQETDPLTTATVQKKDGEQEYTYRAAFLPPGLYTVAFTSQADQDDPEQIDSIDFLGGANVEVFAGEETTHDFNETEE